MEDQISKSDLNRMAQFDGEQPLYADLVDNEDHSEDLEKALMFSAQLREQLSTGIAKEPLPDAWIELIQDTKLVGAAQVETKVASPQASQPFALRLKQLFAPKLAWGGGLSMAVLGGIFWQTQVTMNLADESAGWESEYTQLTGAPLLSRNYEMVFSGSFFTQPQTTVRGSDLGTFNYLNANSDFEGIVPTLRAMKLNGDSFARIIGSEIVNWVAIRGNLSGSSDQGTDCELIQISSGTEKEPAFSGPSTFLSYCSTQLSNTITFLGKT